MGGRQVGTLGERLRVTIERRGADTQEALLMGRFAAQLLLDAHDGVLGLPDEEVTALVRSMYRFVAAPGAMPRARVVAPTWMTDGWDAPVSVIEVNVPDQPFVVETLRAECAARGIAVRAVLFAAYEARRDATGALVHLDAPARDGAREIAVHMAIPRLTDPDVLRVLEARMGALVGHLGHATADADAMLNRARAMAERLEARASARGPRGTSASVSAAELLRWAIDGRFILLGVRDLVRVGDAMVTRAGSGQGLWRDGEGLQIDDDPAALEARRVADADVWVGAARVVSPIVRQEPLVALHVADRDDDHRWVGECQFVGLFTTRATAEEAAEVPVLRRHLRQHLAAERVHAGSPAAAAHVAAFNGLSKAVAFSTLGDDLGPLLLALRGAPRPAPRIVAWARPECGMLTLVAVGAPAQLSQVAFERASRAVTAAQPIATIVEQSRRVVEGAVVASWVLVTLDPDVARLRRVVEEALADLEHRLAAVLAEQVDPVRAGVLARAWGPRVDGERAIQRVARDVLALASVAESGTPAVVLEDTPAGEATLVHLWVRGAPLMLATVVTALGQAALRVLEATHVVVTAPDGGLCAHHRLRIADALGRPLDRVAHAEGIGRLLRAAAAGTLPPPAFVPLLLEPTIAPQGLRLLEAFATIAAQEAGIATVDVMAAVATHPAIASDAASAIADVARGDVDAERSVARFERGLRGVACVDTRSALGAVREVIARTRRTHGADHDDASTPVVVVLDGAHREDPESTWVVAPEVVGVMLRARPAARVLEASAPLATLRREADEALADDLVAMADTVTRGAVARWAPIAGTEPPAARAIFREGVEAVSDAVEAVWAPEVSAVAADVAGRLAWERVRALAWSIGLDPMTTPYTVAALADPTDDASGGLLTHTESARVVAVTDGRHVLVDPDPAPAAVEERRRLASRNEGWDGFDPALLSEGFVFSSCGTTDALLSRGARRVLGLPDDGLTGQGLARAVLEAPVDIVWVGGPPAEPIRVDAVRARVVTGADGLSREVRVALALAGHAVDGDGSAAAVGRRVADAVVSMPEEDAAARREATLLAETSRRVRRAVVAARQSRDHLDELRDLLTTIDHVVPHGRARWGLPDDAALRARAMRGVGLVVPEVTMVRAAVAAWCEATAGVSGPAVAPLIDELGLLALPRLVRETGCSLARAIRTMQLAWAAVDGAVLAAEIDAAGLPLDDDVSARDVLSRAVTDVARWVLDEIAEGACTDATATALHRAMAIAPDDPSSWLVGAEAERWHHRVAALELGGVPSPVAVRLARASWAPALFDVVDVARASGLPLDDVGRAYGALVGTVDLVWIAERLETLGATGSPWTRTAAITTGAWLRRVRRDLVRDDRALEPAAALVRAARASGEAGLDVIVAVVHALMRATAAQGGTSWQ